MKRFFAGEALVLGDISFLILLYLDIESFLLSSIFREDSTKRSDLSTPTGWQEM